MIPAAVTRSATTVPGSGIDVALCGVVLVYMFVKFSEGVGMGVGTGAIGLMMTGGGEAGNRGTGSTTGAGDGMIGSGATGSTTGVGDGMIGSGATGSTTGVGDGTTGSGTGFATGVGDAGVGERSDSMDGFDGDFGLGELSGAQASEKFPGPHTSIAAPGGAAAK
jgi:hypothetical protein